MKRLRASLFLLGVSLLVAAGLARLGVWQLHRAAEKEALQAAIERRAALPVLSNRDLATGADAAASTLHQRVRLRGHWQDRATIYLDNRPMAGRVGFIVVTPLRLEGRTDAIAVQRGWIPRDAADRTLLAPVPTPDGLVEVEGRLAAEPGALLELAPAGDDPPGRIRQNLKLDAYGLESGLPLFPLTVLQQQGPGKTPDAGLVRDWPSPVVNVQKHYGYAFQWFAMSALVVGLYVWFQLIRPSRSSR
jgi:surfeit locus 1 family protein